MNIFENMGRQEQIFYYSKKLDFSTYIEIWGMGGWKLLLQYPLRTGLDTVHIFWKLQLQLEADHVKIPK